MFKRSFRQSGIRHILTKPRSPTTIGKAERFHETLRRELFNKHTPVRIETARAALDDYRFRETSASLVTTWIGKAVAPRSMGQTDW